MSSASKLEVKSLPNARFGAEIIGLDPTHISDADRHLIWDTYRQRHGLICFSFQELIDEQNLHNLTAVFGENEFAPGLINGLGKATPTGEEHISVEEQLRKLREGGRDPYMTYLGNLDPKTLNKKPTPEKFFGEWEWHTDMSYIEVPPTFSLLHARVVPDEGGDTGFCSQVMAAKALSPQMREKVLKLKIKHDSTYGSSGIPRPGMTAPASPIEAIGYPHPILREVPGTDSEALFLGRRTNGYIMGSSLQESEALLDELWAHATQTEFCYLHQWKVGQVMVWDNRMMLHKRTPFGAESARFMWRTQTKGEAVVPVV